MTESNSSKNEFVDSNFQQPTNINIETQTCWKRIKAKIHFAWTYVKPPVAYVWDVAVDTYRTVYYFLQHDYVVGGISSAIIIVAILVSMKYKWQMNAKDLKKRSSSLTTTNQLLNVHGGSPGLVSDPRKPTLREKMLNSIVLVWYWRKLREAWSSGELKSKNDYMIDTSLLGILENFIENCPQLNLTWFYVFWRHEEIGFVPSIAMKSISLLVLTWSIPSYMKAVRRSRGEENLTKWSIVVLYFWNVLQIIPRILILSIFAAEYPIQVAIYLSCHVIVMFVLLLCVVERNPELYNTRCLTILHCIVFGFVYIYTYINIADNKHKLKAVIIFYVISVIGNSIITFCYLSTYVSFILIGIYYTGIFVMILHSLISKFCIKA